jgi:hypothetical protein
MQLKRNGITFLFILIFVFCPTITESEFLNAVTVYLTLPDFGFSIYTLVTEHDSFSGNVQGELETAFY